LQIRIPHLKIRSTGLYHYSSEVIKQQPARSENIGRKKKRKKKQTMANIFRNTFGELLYIAPFDSALNFGKDRLSFIDVFIFISVVLIVQKPTLAEIARVPP
jgi:hypothetical protein